MLNITSDTNPSEKVYTTRQVADQLGLSVSTVQQLVEAGELTAWKTRGGHRRIPGSAVEQFLSSQNITSLQHERHTAISPGISSLLILEDDLVQQTLYRKRISDWGLPVTLKFCSNGYDALIEVAIGQPDILLLDIMMEGIDGYEVLKALTSRPNFRLSHIAVLSNLSAQEIEQRGGLPAGVLYMHKPINFDELRGYLRACCAVKTRLYHK